MSHASGLWDLPTAYPSEKGSACDSCLPYEHTLYQYDINDGDDRDAVTALCLVSMALLAGGLGTVGVSLRWPANLTPILLALLLILQITRHLVHIYHTRAEPDNLFPSVDRYTNVPLILPLSTPAPPLGPSLQCGIDVARPHTRPRCRAIPPAPLDPGHPRVAAALERMELMAGAEAEGWSGRRVSEVYAFGAGDGGAPEEGVVPGDRAADGKGIWVVVEDWDL